MTTQKIDVLAVMDDLIACANYNSGGGYPVEGDAAGARAAVAELIEADREYDAATAEKIDPPNKRFTTLERIDSRMAAATARRAAALARIGGAP